jgi:GDP-L-fucose synthase
LEKIKIMESNKKIMVTGAKGLVGSQIKADIKIGKEYDLTDPHQSNKMVEDHKPTHIIHCAAKVGGIGGNMAAMGEYYYNNLMIGTNVIESARKFGVKKLLAFSSTCVFPSTIELPLTEEKIHLGPPHETNYGYAHAKRANDIQIKAYNQQYGTEYFSVIPCNIYGPNDNYNLETSHVIPSLIHKAYLAKINNIDLQVWGSGKGLRQFIFSKDVAKLSEILIENYNGIKPVIMATSEEVSIAEVVTTICDIMKFQNKIVFDTAKPDGQLRKYADNSHLKSIVGDYQFTKLQDGLEETIEYFIQNYNNVRK